MPYSKERFFSGHSLILGNTPKILTAAQLESMPVEDQKIDLEAFGLFNTASPDFNKYFPDVTAEDLKPKDEDYVYPTMRALSATLVNRYGPIDFSKPGVLKNSMPKLRGQTVYPNHESMVGNDVGVVFETYWGNSYTDTATGFKIPAGINVRLKIDGKANPKLARSLQSEPPSVHSGSVSIGFQWEQSHKMSEDEFFAKIGTLDAKGELIRRVVTMIALYEEYSLVSHGQDPYAQSINDKGHINNPINAEAKRYKFSASDYQKHGSYMDWKDISTSLIQLTEADTIPTGLNNDNNSTKKHEPMNEELLKFLRLQLGLADDATEAVVLAKLNEQLPKLAKANTDLTTANTELSALKAKYPEGTVALSKEDNTLFETLKTSAAARLTKLKAEALKLYNLSVGGADRANAGVVKLINENTDEANLTALYQSYSAQVEGSLQLTCQGCGGHNIVRASSAGAALGIQNPDGSTSTDTAAPVVKTHEEALEQFRKAKSHTKGLYATK